MIHNLWFFLFSDSEIAFIRDCDQLEVWRQSRICQILEEISLRKCFFPEKLSPENQIGKKSRKEIDCREKFYKMSRNHPVNVEKPGAIIIESVRNLIDTNPRNEFKY